MPPVPKWNPTLLQTHLYLYFILHSVIYIIYVLDKIFPQHNLISLVQLIRTPSVCHSELFSHWGKPACFTTGTIKGFHIGPFRSEIQHHHTLYLRRHFILYAHVYSIYIVRIKAIWYWWTYEWKDLAMSVLWHGLIVANTKKNGEKREIIQSVFIRVHRMRHPCHPWFERHSEEDTREWRVLISKIRKTIPSVPKRDCWRESIPHTSTTSRPHPIQASRTISRR